MKKLFTLFVALIATITLWAGNTITYTATSKVNPYNTGAFGANITSHTFADGTGTIIFNGDVTSIGDRAFYYCSSLTSITIPNSVMSFGDGAFYNCSSLTSIIIGNSVTSIGKAAFAGCSGLTSITIPNSVTSIAEAAFYDCSGLTSIIIGNSVTSIGNWAFRDCSSLTSITCEAVTPPACGDVCFGDVDKSIPLYVPAESVEAYKTAAEWKDFTNIQSIATQKTEFNTITYTATSKLSETTDEWYDGLHTNAFDVSITSHTFADGTGTITFNGDVTLIGDYAFRSCSGLTSITIPNSVTLIGDGAFRSCSSLTSITIPNSVTSIGELAFCSCSSLTSIIIGNSVTSIGDYAFFGCSGLTSITCEAVTPPACGDDCFEYVDHTIPLYVPEESVEAYKTAEVWKDFTNIQPIVPNALDNAIAPTDNLRKFMRNGQVLIQRGDMIYNLHGQVVE